MLLFSSGSIEVILEPAKDRVIFLLCPDTRNLRVEWGCTFFLYMIVRVYVFLLPTAHTDCSTGPFINLCKWRILPIMYFLDTMVRTQSAQCTYTVRECLQKIFNVPKYRQLVSSKQIILCQLCLFIFLFLKSVLWWLFQNIWQSHNHDCFQSLTSLWGMYLRRVGGRWSWHPVWRRH